MINKKIISNLAFIFTIFILFSQSSFAMSHYVCLNEGESLASGWTCTSQCCSNICVNENNYQTNPSSCYGLPGCSCDGGNDFNNDFTPPEVTINEPEADYAYDSRSIPFEITLNEVAYRLEYQEKGQERRGWIRLCPGKCVSYSGHRTFKDGEHTITVRAIDGNGNIGNSTVKFYVDSLAPKIRKVLPANRDYCNGEFTIEYAENNVVSISLFYKDSSMNGFNEVVRTDCLSGSKETCVFNVDSLAQGDLEYYFTITDRSQTVESKHQNVVVDSVPPELTVVLPENKVYDTRKIQFDISTNEESDLSYIDEMDRRPREIRLCRNCLSYDKSKSFKDGEHRIVIIAKDPAGNKVNKTIEFTIDSKPPRIQNSEPRNRKYGNGTFSVNYDEMSPVRVSLYYSYDDVNFESKDNLECGGGRRGHCEIKVDDIEQGIVYYYFEIEDIAGNVVKQRRETQVTIDTIPPNMQVFSPVNQIYDTRRILFNLTSDETVRFEYKNLNSIHPRWKTLRSRAMAYENSRYFTYGNYDLLIRATDLAGNFVVEEVNFQVVRHG